MGAINVADILTMQDLANGHLDVKALGDAANGDENTIVTTRTGNTYPSAERAINIMFQNGGLPAKPFATKALLQSSALVDGQYAMVTDDTVNNGLYVKTAGAWVKSAYDPLTQAKAYTDTNKADTLSKVQNTFDTKALMTASPLPDGSKAFVGSDTTADNNGFYKKTAGAWVKGAYDPLTQAKAYTDINKADTLSKVQNTFDTKALMTASLLPDGSKAFVGSDTAADNNGFYKKTAGAWVKGSYDPLAQSKTYTDTAKTDAIASAKTYSDTAVAKSVDSIDVSALSGNYKLTLAEAIALVPTEVRKSNLVLNFNRNQSYVYKRNTTISWDNIRFWLRPQDYEGRVNYFSEKDIYRGFTLTNYGNTTTLGENNYVAIIPITGIGYPSTITITTGLHTLKDTQFYFLDSNLSVINSVYNTSLLNHPLPANAAYVLINLESESGGVVTNAGNLDIARKYLTYTPIVDPELTSKPTPADGFKTIEYGLPPSTAIEYSIDGQKAVNPYFVGGLKPFKGIHITQIVKSVKIFKGHYSLINATTGTYRKFTITQISKNLSGVLSVNIDAEQSDGTSGFLNTPRSRDIVDGLMYIELANYNASPGDAISVRLVIDPSVIPNNTILYFNENGQIHPSIVAFADRAQGRNRGEQITEFMDVGVSSVFSNMALPQAKPIQLTRQNINGFPVTKVVGDLDKDHQQTTLIGSKKSNFYSNNANIYVDAVANYPSNPSITRLIGGSSASGQDGIQIGEGLIGANDNQWIHPDMCHANPSVGGYKYWMVDSLYPNGNDRVEDVELFVSNDAMNWKRVRGFLESSDDGIGFKNPQVFWDTKYPNAFLPIPITGNSFEFAKQSVTETSTILGYLNHDPAITYHDGYVIAYILYNFGFTIPNNYNHKYIICLRTNNGTDWEIVRQDGSTMPYNEANAKLLFTKTNGVRNHHYYKTTTASIAGRDLSPQMVKVSDTEFHMYTRDEPAFTKPSAGVGLDMIRYSGTTPYTIDYSNGVVMSRDNATSNRLWHFGMRFYNGKYYLLTNGFMLTSTDGLNFKTPTHPFFWRGMSADLYKPTFVLGHDGKVKIAYGIGHWNAAPHAYAPQITQGLPRNNLIFVPISNTGTYICQYDNLTDIENRGAVPTKDAYVDVAVMIISQRTKTIAIHLIPAVRGFTQLKGVSVSYDDEIYAVAYLNTRNGGTVTFGGVAVTEDNAIFH